MLKPGDIITIKKIGKQSLVNFTRGETRLAFNDGEDNFVINSSLENGSDHDLAFMIAKTHRLTVEESGPKIFTLKNY